MQFVVRCGEVDVRGAVDKIGVQGGQRGRPGSHGTALRRGNNRHCMGKAPRERKPNRPMLWEWNDRGMDCRVRSRMEGTRREDIQTNPSNWRWSNASWGGDRWPDELMAKT